MCTVISYHLSTVSIVGRMATVPLTASQYYQYVLALSFSGEVKCRLSDIAGMEHREACRNG